MEGRPIHHTGPGALGLISGLAEGQGINRRATVDLIHWTCVSANATPAPINALIADRIPRGDVAWFVSRALNVLENRDYWYES